MAHIVNLAQQAFICALIGNTESLVETRNGDTGNNDEIDLSASGLEVPMSGGPLIGPLLSHFRALIVRVSYDSAMIISQSDIESQQIPQARNFI
jgi:hypothetical protein